MYNLVPWAFSLAWEPRVYVPPTNVWGVQKESGWAKFQSCILTYTHKFSFQPRSHASEKALETEVTFIYGRFQISAKLVLHNAFCHTVLPLISAMNM